MLNLKSCTYKVYEPVFSKLAPATQNRIRAIYNDQQGCMRYMAVLAYAVHSTRAKKMSFSAENVLAFIDKQVAEVGDASPYIVVEASRVLDKFNTMNREYFRHKKDNTDERMPYVIFEACVWYLPVVKFLKEFDKTEYPLVSGWVEFFMALPLSGRLDSDDRGEVVVEFYDYIRAVRHGWFYDWYAEKYGYGSKRSPMSRSSFKEMYAEELQGMSAKELDAELAKNNWGRQAVKDEITKRAGRRGV